MWQELMYISHNEGKKNSLKSFHLVIFRRKQLNIFVVTESPDHTCGLDYLLLISASYTYLKVFLLK